MKRKIYISPIALVSLVCLFILNSTPVFAASVASLTSLGSGINEAGETIALVSVKCSSAATGSRTIVSKEGQRDWCSQDIPDVCSKNKVSAAQKVCRTGFTARAEEFQRNNGSLNTNADVSSNPAPATQQVQETVDEISLEKERIRAAQEKLEIRRQELEANKRRLELERQGTN